MNKEYRKRLTSLTLGLLIFAFLNIILINFAIGLFLPQCIQTVKSTIDFLKFREGEDSWKTMTSALNYIKFDHQKPLYSEIFFDRKIKFQYPPSSLLIIYLLQGAFQSWYGVLKYISWISVVVTAFFAIKIFNVGLKDNTIDRSRNYFSKFDLITRSVVLFCLALTFYPVVKSYSLGQIQTWLNAIFAILILCWMKEKKAISGILAGIICLIKPQYFIIFLWGLLRKQRIFVLTFALVVIFGLLVSISLFGITDHIDYLNVLSFVSKHGEAYYPNQSMNGLLNRLLLNGNNLEWKAHSFAPFNPFIFLGTITSSAVLILMALFWPTRVKERGGIIDFSIVALTSTLASPVAWEYHYGILLPIYAFFASLSVKVENFWQDDNPLFMHKLYTV